MQEQNELIYLKILKNGNIFECLGVLQNEDEEKLEIVFNACNDKIVDSISVEKKDILERINLEEKDVEIYF